MRGGAQQSVNNNFIEFSPMYLLEYTQFSPFRKITRDNEPVVVSVQFYSAVLFTIAI